MRYTFIQLLNEYHISIPLIQRDYAQGRIDEKAEAVRNHLVPALKKALQQGVSFDFDFIYGTVKEDVLLPLDGQQRLTTLFLLHWYLNMKEEGDLTKSLQRFSYETRLTTKDFLEHLIERKYKLEDFSDESISKVILNEKWFRHQWKFDPNIKGMLTMLDLIHLEFHSITQEMCVLLTSNECPITFSFMNLDEFKLGEELYIKMNARGRALSTFENFKAQFEQLLESFEYFDEMNEFSFKLDRDWTDLLWEHLGIEKTLDRPFLNIFTFISSTLQVKKFVSPDVFESKRYTDMDVLREIYNEKEAVQYLFDVLDAWNDVEDKKEFFAKIEHETPLFIEEPNLFKSLVETGNITLLERIYFYTVTQALLHDKKEELPELLRIVRNLVQRVRQERQGEYTSNLRYDSIEGIFKVIDLFIENKQNPYNTLFTIEKSPSFTRDSIEQERLKATLLKTRPELVDALFKLEDIREFSGNLSAIFSSFEKYDKKLVDVIIEMITLDQGLIARVLLTCEDYKHQLGNSTLGENHSSKRYLYGGNARKAFLWTTANLQKVWEEVFNRYFAVKKSSVKETLQYIIDTENRWGKMHYAYYFVKYPIIFSEKHFTFVFESEKGLLIEKISGKTIQSLHINPIYEAVINEIPSLCLENKSIAKSVERSSLVTNFGDILWLEDGEWTTTKTLIPVLDKYKVNLAKDLDLVEQGVQLVKLLDRK
ncbi:hypothetical protein CN491_01765 [Bacillus cereus]|uniref:GmrSD restriction endonucleases N-terminal domain-containing protein n=1 Tax=Bacillus cereus TaxID=1396 RepID=A0A2A8LW05_BACCE|nr:MULTISPECIES: DUF262 domain-containing protein [Bacillus cereus group]MDR4984363.1 DUF262 domain-containing protein [Bacillus cereus]PES99599.1 hypothetical protein CN491_01765 [Bacillus cereus]PFP80090.1 hypothetical protein COJ95_09325 [Bacillus cereus]